MSGQEQYDYKLVHLSDFPRIEDSASTSANGNTVYSVPSGVEVLAVGAETGVREWSSVATYSQHKNVALWLSQFRDGGFVFSSEREGLVTLDPITCTLTTTSTTDAVGRFVPIDSEPQRYAPVTHVTATGQEGRRGVVGVRGKSMQPVSFDMPLTYTTGLFVGLILGDGWVDKSGLLYLAGSTKEKLINRERFREICQTTELPYVIYGNTCKDIDRVSKNIVGNMTSRGKTKISCAWFNTWLGTHIGSQAWNKKIPAFSLSAPDDHLLGILDGLISTDGSVSFTEKSAQLKIDTTSMELCNGLSVLFARLGLHAAIRTYRSKLGKRPAYALMLTAASVSRLKYKYDFKITHTHKRNTFDTYAATVKDIPQEELGYKIPVPPIICDQLLKVIPKTEHAFRGDVRAASRYGRLLPRSLVARYLPCAQEPTVANYRQLVVDNTTIHWRKVYKTTNLSTTIEAYDLTVPNKGTFCLASGVYVKNCDGDQLNINVPASEDARREVIEKMLPSKNLLGPASFAPMYVPSNEASLGLFQLSTEDKKNEAKHYKTEADVIKAFEKGELMPGDNVKIG